MCLLGAPWVSRSHLCLKVPVGTHPALPITASVPPGPWIREQQLGCPTPADTGSQVCVWLCGRPWHTRTWLDLWGRTHHIALLASSSLQTSRRCCSLTRKCLMNSRQSGGCDSSCDPRRSSPSSSSDKSPVRALSLPLGRARHLCRPDLLPGGYFLSSG